MRRMWFGVGVLLGILLVSVLVMAAFSRIYDPLAEKMEQAGEAVLREDWDTALRLSGQARQDWQRSQHFAAAVTDHEPIEQTDALFSQLQIWAQLRQREEFATTCAALAQILRAIGESQQLPWWNLL